MEITTSLEMLPDDHSENKKTTLNYSNPNICD